VGKTRPITLKAGTRSTTICSSGICGQCLGVDVVGAWAWCNSGVPAGRWTLHAACWCDYPLHDALTAGRNWRSGTAAAGACSLAQSRTALFAQFAGALHPACRHGGGGGGVQVDTALRVRITVPC